MENALIQEKKKKTLKYYHHMIDRKYRILFRWLYLAQKLDNSVKIVKITGHAWRRKVVPGRRVIPAERL